MTVLKTVDDAVCVSTIDAVCVTVMRAELV